MDDRLKSPEGLIGTRSEIVKVETPEDQQVLELVQQVGGTVEATLTARQILEKRTTEAKKRLLELIERFPPFFKTALTSGRPFPRSMNTLRGIKPDAIVQEFTALVGTISDAGYLSEIVGFTIVSDQSGSSDTQFFAERTNLWKDLSKLKSDWRAYDSSPAN